jgi:hypothetical protein
MHAKPWTQPELQEIFPCISGHSTDLTSSLLIKIGQSWKKKPWCTWNGITCINAEICMSCPMLITRDQMGKMQLGLARNTEDIRLLPHSFWLV